MRVPSSSSPLERKVGLETRKRERDSSSSLESAVLKTDSLLHALALVEEEERIVAPCTRRTRAIPELEDAAYSDSEANMCQKLYQKRDLLLTEEGLAVQWVAAASSHQRSLWSSDDTPQLMDCAATVDALLRAVSSNKKGHDDECMARQRETADFHAFFSDPLSPVCRPFLSASWLTHVKQPHDAVKRVLCAGDAVHVPFSREEATALLSVLDVRPWRDFEGRLERSIELLPGRSLSDVRRFLRAVVDYRDVRRDDPLFVRVIFYHPEKGFSTSLQSQAETPLSTLLGSRTLDHQPKFTIGKLRTASVLSKLFIGSSSNMHVPGARVPQVIRRYNCNVGGPVNCKFSPFGAPFRALAVGLVPSGRWQLLLFNLEAKDTHDDPCVNRLYGHDDRERGVYEASSGSINDLQWSCFGSHLLSASADCTVKVWTPDSGRLLHTLDHRHPVRVLSVPRTREDRCLSTAWSDSGLQLSLWDTASGERLCQYEKKVQIGKHVHSLHFLGRGDDNLVCGTRSHSATAGEVLVLDVETCESILRARPHCMEVTQCGVANRSGHVFLSGSSDSKVCLFDLRDSRPIVRQFLLSGDAAITGPQPELNQISFSMCDQFIQAACSTNDVFVWDARGSVNEPVMHGFHEWPSSNASHRGFESVAGAEIQGIYGSQWAPFGTTLLTGGEDGSLRVWDITRGDFLVNSVQGHSNCVSALDVSPCGSAVATGGDDRFVALYTDGSSRFKLGKMERKLQ